MAVIGKIRERSGLLIFLIGLSIVGFIIMDFTNSQSSVLRGRNETVGEVNGEEINIKDFETKYSENVKNAEEQMRGQSMGEDQRNYLRTQTWNEMVSDILFDKVYARLGVNVTGDELAELMMGENASQYVQNDQQFRNPNTGQFDPTLVKTYINQLDAPRQGVDAGVVRRQWLKFESLLKQNQFQIKYNNLITKGLYVPAWMGEMIYNDQTRTVDFKYVQLSYDGVKEEEVKVSDDDLKKYLEEHEAKYKLDEETRKIQYVAFDLAASAADTAKIISDLEKQRAEFEKSETPSDDSLLLIGNSEEYDGVYYEKDKLYSPVKDSFFILPVKSIVGPYVEGNNLKLSKISDRKMISDSVRVQEIVFSFAGLQSGDPLVQEKYRLMDSVQNLIDSLHQDFGLLASQFSDDPLGKTIQGNIGWVKKDTKGKDYNDVIFYRAVKGKTYRAVEGEGVRLFRVIEEKPSKPGVLISSFVREIIPGTETTNAIYSKAAAFATDNSTETKFKEAGKKNNIKTVETVRQEDFSIPGIGTSRDLVKWIYGKATKKGQVSQVFIIDRKLVVVMLDQIRAKGLPELDAVRETIKPLVVQQKKFEVLSKKITEAKASTIDDLAAKLGATVSTAERVTFGSPGSYEPEVVATALATSTGKLSKPVKTNSGTYVVQTISVQEPPKQTDYRLYAFSTQQQLQNKARYAQEVHKKLADIDDNRIEFF